MTVHSLIIDDTVVHILGVTLQADPAYETISAAQLAAIIAMLDCEVVA